MSDNSSNLVLLTGATGYVGGRLLPLLVETGWRVRCLARRPDHLVPRVPTGVEVVPGDLLDAASLAAAMRGVQTAFYLVHSMSASDDFEAQDRLAADNFAAAARAAGVQRIIYLGGLGEDEPGLSAHLRSRHEVGKRLRAHGVPVIEFRASIIIGSGSLSFEMIRALVERLPVMLTPRWVDVAAQPIAIGDVLAYLREAVKLNTNGHVIFEIGGPDRVSYGDLMREYARQRSLRRLTIRVPFLTPRLSSLWLGLVTPLFARVGRKLIDSIRHPTVVRDPAAVRTFSIRPISTSEAIARALRNEDSRFAQTRWSDALSSATAARPWGGTRFGNRLVDSRSTRVRAAAPRAFATVEGIGGKAGWHYANWLWTVRGWLDLLVGGVGMRRGRRDPARLRVGDVVDCWRVEAIEPDRRLRLQAEMKLPGRAWLDFEVRQDGEHARLSQTAIFDPVGLWGLAYWYGVWPLHQLVFAGMLRGLARAAEKKHLLAAAAGICFHLTMNTATAAEKTLFDFTTTTNVPGCQVVNDDVMGGISTSKFEVTNGVAVFRGELSLENNGGFASVRSSPVRQKLAGLDAFVVRVRGDGRRYKFTARTESGFDTPVYQCAFTTRRGEWEEHRLAFKDFVPTFRGRVLIDAPALDPARVVSVGFLIADRQAGPFHLDVAWIRAAPRAGK